MLEGEALSGVKVIFRQAQDPPGGNHWGSRLVFAQDGKLFVTLGDRFNHRDRAQDLTSHFGKIVRIAADGSVPADNPFVKTPNALPEIWSIGHRNLQGAVLDPRTGRLWTSEHGAQGGDEINIPEAGKNYGWPVITHGVDYSGATIGIGSEKAGMEQPVLHWTPSIAPSGPGVLRRRAFPGLARQPLCRLAQEPDAGEDGTEGRPGGSPGTNCWQSMRERIRDVRQGPDGYLYVLTDDAAGRLLRLEPVGP